MEVSLSVPFILCCVSSWASVWREEGTLWSLTVDHQENCSKGIDPLNNRYMTDVMILAELLLLREREGARRRRTDLATQPTMKLEWNSETKQAETFRSYSHSFRLFWTARALDDYDLASAKNNYSLCGLRTSIDCNESPYSVNSRS